MAILSKRLENDIIHQNLMKGVNICLDALPKAWKSKGLLPGTQDCRLRMRRECRERFPRHRNRLLAIPICITARVWCTCRDVCRDRNPQIYVSGKRPIEQIVLKGISKSDREMIRKSVGRFCKRLNNAIAWTKIHVCAYLLQMLPNYSYCKLLKTTKHREISP